MPVGPARNEERARIETMCDRRLQQWRWRELQASGKPAEKFPWEDGAQMVIPGLEGKGIPVTKED